VVFLLVSTPLTRLNNWTEFKKFLMKALSAISYGLTLMIDVAGVSLPEVLATLSGRISLNSSTTPTTSYASPVLIN